MESRIIAANAEAVKTRTIIYNLEKDREKYGIQAAEAMNRLLAAQVCVCVCV